MILPSVCSVSAVTAPRGPEALNVASSVPSALNRTRRARHTGDAREIAAHHKFSVGLQEEGVHLAVGIGLDDEATVPSSRNKARLPARYSADVGEGAADEHRAARAKSREKAATRIEPSACATSALTWSFGLGSKLRSSEPLALSRARRCGSRPNMLGKAPPRRIEPSDCSATRLTGPPALGSNEASRLPLV